MEYTALFHKTLAPIHKTYEGIDPKTGQERWRMEKSFRKNGQATHVHRLAIGDLDLALKIIDILEIVHGVKINPSIKATFGEGLDLTSAENGGAGMASVYSRLKRELGAQLPDKNFPTAFWGFIDHLRAAGYKVNTLSNYKAVAKHTLHRMVARGLIPAPPIVDFEIEREFRARVWSTAERERIYDTMKRIDSPLYWSVYFSERNPIRCYSDLWNLTRENLITEGPGVPYVEFQPRKTQKRRPGRTLLSNITPDLLGYWKKLFETFPDCPYLFPRVLKVKSQPVAWKRMIEPRRHWKTICKEKNANVPDFHFHDLRHIAITGMLKAGWTREQLKKLGVQHTDRALQVYDHTTAIEVLVRGPGSVVSRIPREPAGY